MIKIYCSYDKISEEYSLPWFAKNDNVAKRNMCIASKRESLPLNDIELYCIAEYDQDTGTIISENTKSEVALLDDSEE